MVNLNHLIFKQGPEGYTWDLGFDENTVRELGK